MKTINLKGKEYDALNYSKNVSSLYSDPFFISKKNELYKNCNLVGE